MHITPEPEDPKLFCLNKKGEVGFSRGLRVKEEGFMPGLEPEMSPQRGALSAILSGTAGFSRLKVF